jgi:hypothetical protein
MGKQDLFWVLEKKSQNAIRTHAHGKFKKF